MAGYLKDQTTGLDRARKAESLHAVLIETLMPLVWAEGEEQEAHDRRKAQERLEASIASPEALERVYTPSDAWDRWFTHNIYGPEPVPGWWSGEIAPAVKRPEKRRRRQWSAAKMVERLSGCQTQWVAYKPTCCDGKTKVVPVGCNERLCPKCNHHRANKYRKQVELLFHKLENPQLLTLTVPNTKHMSRLVLDTLRTRWKAFRKVNEALLLGGVMSIEVTYSDEAGWHPHIHALVDVAGPADRLQYDVFRQRKWRLEFDWLVLTQGKNKRWKANDFWLWMAETRPFERGREKAHAGDCNRRIVDIRPVTKDKKASYEVLKYISKCSFFIRRPAAIRELSVAMRGVRQIQTFGTCYNFKLDEAAEGEAAGAELQCSCEKKTFIKIVLGLGMVFMSPDGEWHIRPDAPLHGRQRCRGSST